MTTGPVAPHGQCLPSILVLRDEQRALELSTALAVVLGLGWVPNSLKTKITEITDSLMYTVQAQSVCKQITIGLLTDGRFAGIAGGCEPVISSRLRDVAELSQKRAIALALPKLENFCAALRSGDG